MDMENLDLVGIGNAIVDVLSQTEDKFLTEHRLNKGAMTLIEAEAADKLYSQMGPGVEMSGGSAANTMAAFASLGGKGGYIGKLANDQLGNVFRHDIKASGIYFDTPPLEDGPPTARCLILVTPDAQRTMCTFLGACVWLGPGDLNTAMISSAKVTYLEGYLFDKDRAKKTFQKAAEIAHAAGKEVALTLSDPFCVKRHRVEFLELVKNHIDILFANEVEIMELFEAKTFEEAAEAITGLCKIAVLTRSDKGSLIISKDQFLKIPPEPVSRIVDTTGAGDAYAAGFLHGYTQGRDLLECGRMASVVAAEIIAQMGARPQRSLAKIIQEKKRGAA